MFLGKCDYMKQVCRTCSVVLVMFCVVVCPFQVMAGYDSSNLGSVNRQVYLGSAKIYGEGNMSRIDLQAENEVLIKIDSKNEFIDFFIEYEMECTGVTDEGIITLTVSLNGENISLNITQTPTSKMGRLLVKNVYVTQGDALVFVIHALYANLIPVYLNETSTTGAGIINKKVTLPLKDNIFLSRVLRNHPLVVLFRYLVYLHIYTG